MKLLKISLLSLLFLGCNSEKVFYYKKDTHRKYKDLLLHTEASKQVKFIESEYIPFYANSISFDNRFEWSFGNTTEYTKIFYFVFDIKKEVHIRDRSWTLENRMKLMDTINTAIRREI